MLSPSTLSIWFLHAECDFVTYECDFDSKDCDLYTHSVIFTRIVTLTRTNIITTLKSVITARTRVWLIQARVEFQPDACDFNTNQLKLT
jgi:hypothetical protein